MGGDGEDGFSVQRANYAGGIQQHSAFAVVSGTYTPVGSASYALATGKLRVVRSGSTVTGYYWSGSWIALGSRTSFGTGPCWVRVWVDQNANGAGEVTFDNFQVNSGAWTNLASWAREPVGANRGAAAAAPLSVLAVATAESVDLLDASNNTLWMRFAYGPNNAARWTDTKVVPRWIAYHGGQLVVAYANEVGDTSDGGVLWVLFDEEYVTCLRTLAAGDSGKPYKRQGGESLGSIYYRNGGYSFAGSASSTRIIPDLRAYGCDVWCDEVHGYIYLGCATAAGLTVIRYYRWFNINVRANWATSEIVRHCWFDRATGDLYWVGTTQLHQAIKATWEVPMPTFGTFVADMSTNLPGTRTHLNQWRPVQVGTKVYMPANEGIFVSDAMGAFVLEYGVGGSGASHETLPTNTGVVSLAHDPSMNSLVLGLAGPNRVAQVFLENHGVVVGLSRDDEEIPVVVAV
jgi:hypothetical protein